MSLLVTPPDRVRLRRVRGLAFIDESGRFQSPIDGKPPERPLVVNVMFRDTAPIRARIAAVVRGLRQRHGPTVKANSLDDSDYRRICDLVADVGYLGWSGVEYGHGEDHPAACRKALDDLAVMLDQMGPRTSRRIDVLSAIRRTQIQLEHADSPNLAAYVVQLIHLLKITARWFRREGMYPDLRVILDERLLPGDRDLLRFLPRLAVSNVFPELFETRLSALWAQTDENTAVVSTDDDCDGLVVADALAFALGKKQRGEDPRGFYAEQIERCARASD
jgi:hypothetical protein